MNVPSRSVVLTIALVLALLVPVGVAQADDIAWKAAHDTDPHLALTQEQLDAIAAKRAAEPQDGDVTPESFVAPMGPCGSCTGGGSYPSSASLVANQTPQATSYYCGPASIHEALDALGVSLSQSAAAAALHTTTGGTAWSGGGTSPSGYPIPDVMNRYQSRNYYVPQPVSSPTASAINTYENDLRGGHRSGEGAGDRQCLRDPVLELPPERASVGPHDSPLVRDPRLLRIRREHAV